MTKGLLFIPLALMLDTFQLLISLGLTGVTSAVGGVLQFIPFFGTAAGAGTAAGGLAIGYIVDTALSLGFGTFLVTLLTYSGMFYGRAVFGTYLAEIFPFINILPGWTFLAIRCTYNKYKEEKAAQVSHA